MMIEIIVTSLVVSSWVCFCFMRFHINQINKINKQLLIDIEKKDNEFRESITKIAIDAIQEKNK